MTDSGSFTSLLALVDSHLSKVNIQQSQSGDVQNDKKIPIPSLNETTSETRFTFSPGQRLPIPSLSTSENSITKVLAEQVANMLKAKELKRQEEEKKKLAEEMEKMKLKEDDYVIDLMQAIQPPLGPRPQVNREEMLSNSSSFESLFQPQFIDCDEDDKDVKIQSPEPLLPCTTDMSYILRQKVCRAKCSAFGRVLTARVRPVAAPYLRSKIDSNIVRFDFKTKSPCDIIKEKSKKRTVSTRCTFDIVNFV